MSFFKKIILRLVSRVISTNSAKYLIVRLSATANINLFELALNNQGILNYSSSELAGEDYFIEKFLPNYFKNIASENLILFDVGANIGKYTHALAKTFPQASIFSFEPNPNSFKLIKANIEKHISKSERIKILPVGLSSIVESKSIVSYQDSPGSSHTSIYKEVFDEFHQSKNNISIDAQFTTLDRICEDHKVDKIHLLKIDTEGHELEVLKGATNLIGQNKIDIIQFEFGECHVYSRVFLRDFYLLLKGFKFYRLLPDRLLPLGEHSPAHEIFRFQNIIAIR